MALFTNQAQMTFGNTVVNSNIAVGEILDALKAEKNATTETYSLGDTLTYVISATNSSQNPITSLTVTDNLGAYTLGLTTVYPLDYVVGSALLYINGVLATPPIESAGPPLVLSGITLPAGASMVLVYNATVNESALLASGSQITNTAIITGVGIDEVEVSETVTVLDTPDITITKSIEPTPVSQGDRVTYRFLIQNFGNTPIIATDNAIVTDTFSPILTNLAVTFNGTAWTDGVEYNYSEATGVFTTVGGQITVPQATYTQAPDGTVTVTPGTAVLEVSGNITI